MGIIGEIAFELLAAIAEEAVESASVNRMLPKGHSASNVKFPTKGNEKSVTPPDSDAAVRNHLEDYQARSERMYGRGSMMMK